MGFLGLKNVLLLTLLLAYGCGGTKSAVDGETTGGTSTVKETKSKKKSDEGEKNASKIKLSFPPTVYTNELVSINWTNPNDAKSFHIIVAWDEDCLNSYVEMELTTQEANLRFLEKGDYFVCLEELDNKGKLLYLTTKEFPVEKGTGSVPATLTSIATITGAPVNTNRDIELDVTIAGIEVTHYRYKIGVDADCSDYEGYSEEAILVATKISDDISALDDGAMKLCVVGKNTAGYWQPFSSATEASWTKDRTPPSQPETFSIFSDHQQNVSSWTAGGSETSDYLLVRRTSAAVTWTPTDGESYAEGLDADGIHTLAYIGDLLTKDETGLTNETTYYYSLYAFDSVYNYSTVKTTSGMPADITPPSTVIGLITAADGTGGADVRYDDDTGIYLVWSAATDAQTGVRDYTVSWYAQADCGGSATDVTGKTSTNHNLTGLGSGTTYSFKILAYNASNYASTSACSGNITVDTSAPATVGGLVTAEDTAVGIDARYDDDLAGIYFTWNSSSDAQSGIRDYTVSWYGQANCAGGATNVTGITTSYYNYTGTASGTTYSFTVTAYNNAGIAATTSSCSGNITVDSSAPSDPTSLITAADASGGADVRYDDDTDGIYFAWTASSDAQSGIRDYTVSWYSQAACGGSATNVTGLSTAYYNLTGTASGTTYSFKVTSYNNAGIASNTTSCSGNIVVDSSAPSDPSSLLTTADASGGADVRYDDDTSGIFFVWTASADAQSGIRDYTVSWYGQADCGGGATDVTGVTTAYYNLTGTASGTTYSFKVKAYNNSGLVSNTTACSANIMVDSSAPSDPASLITAADASGGADVRYDDDTSGIYFAWTASSDAQSDIRDYTVSWYGQANCGGAATDVTGVTTAYHNLTGTASGTTYSFKVTAYNNSGLASNTTACSGNILVDSSAPSDPSSLVTAADASGGADVRYDNDTDGIYFAWTASADAQSSVRDYTLSWYAQSNCGGAATDVTGITDVFYNLTGTASGTTYSFKVKAYNNAGLVSNTTACSGDITIDTSAPSDPSSLITAADASGGADVRYDDDTSGVYFAWTASTDAQSGIRDYTVSWYGQANCGGAATDVTGVTTAYHNLTGTASGTTYSFKVTAYNNSGFASNTTACSGNILVDSSAPSDPSNLVTAADASGGADVRYDDDTSGIYFAWTASSDAQSAVRDYTVSWYAQSACGGGATDVTGITDAFYNLTGTASGTTYSFKVKAYNNAGLVSNTTACSGNITVDSSEPATVGGLITAADSSAGANVTSDDDSDGIYFVWTASSDAQSNIRDYTVKHYAEAACGGSATDVTGVSDTYYNLTSVAEGTTYSFKVIAYNNAGLASTLSNCSGDITVSAAAGTLVASISVDGPMGRSSMRKSFYDSTNDRRWVFYYTGSAIGYAYSSDNAIWNEVSTVAENTDKFSLTYGIVNAVPYVFLVTESNTYDVVLYRGEMGASSITFDSPITVFNGTSVTDRYRIPSIAINGDDKAVVVASYSTASSSNPVGHRAVVKTSSNTAEGDLSAWSASTNVTNNVSYITDLAIVPQSTQNTYIVVNHSALETYLFDGSSALAATGGDYSWFNFPSPRLNSGSSESVSAVAVIGSDLYVAGNFQDLGGNPSADYIARWDGSYWHPLGIGLNNTVNVLTVSGGALYVGGTFTDAGGNTSADYVAKWDGYVWQNFGTGPNGAVHEIIVDGANVYVGGSFTNAGGNASADGGVVYWNGSAWNPLGDGTEFNSGVTALLKDGTDFYVGGDFTDLDGIAEADRIAKWNGTTWSALGSGIDNANVYTIVKYGTDYLVGGAFTNADGNADADYIVRWDGDSWEPLSTGLNSTVNAIVVSGSDAYITGVFDNGGTAAKFTRWDGADFNAVGVAQGISGNAIFKNNNDIYIGGSSQTGMLAFYNTVSTTWTKIGETDLFNGTIRAIAISGSDIYIGGSFTAVAGNANANYIVKWNGTAWSALGNASLNGAVHAIVINGADVYVGGDFTDADGNGSADYIAKWNGSAWSALASGVNSSVYALLYTGGSLYVGGLFTDAGGDTAADRIALWNGTAFIAFGAAGAINNGYVAAIESSSGAIFAGGSFTDNNSVAEADNILRWSGAAWEAVDTGLNGAVYALEDTMSGLYIGGAFTNAGGVAAADYVVSWDGMTWNPLGNGITTGNSVRALASTEDGIYVAGDFSHVDSVEAGNIAYYSGSSWTVYGKGTSNTVRALALLTGKIHVGGDFLKVKASSTLSYSSQYFAILAEAVTNTYPYGFSATKSYNSGDALHMLYINRDGYPAYRSSGGENVDAQTVLASEAGYSPTIAHKNATNDLYAYWTNSSSVIRHAAKTAGAWGAASSLTSSGEISNLNCDPIYIDGGVNLFFNDVGSSKLYMQFDN